jgi:hypothetical protein
MRWLLLLLPLIVSAADLRIDHVTVAGRDLKAMDAALQRAGIPMVYGGPHANGVTEMSLCSFPDGSYLEAIAPVAGADPAKVKKHEWSAFLTEGATACAWAVRSDNLDADRRRLRDAGIVAGAPVDGGRARPDGVRLDWQTMDIGGGVRGALYPFLIHDVTPREQRAYPTGKPTSTEFSGVARVVIGVHDLDDAVAQYRRAFGLAAPVRTTDQRFGARLAAFPGSPVVLAQPLGAGNWIEEQIYRFGEGPCAFILRAARPQAAAAGASRWFGEEIRWVDPRTLEWRLGIADPVNHR